ncbi:Serine protease, subtilisin family [Agromyces sp. CF514]|uniref:S8 family peptidase n=1 Tax=Agromyces sp. CF514 TaxID=1881031 RepID=UPI0008F419A9|nr:S8 family serine peptidase [Agromyces sp. CF514]SFR83827.1 Serine protease, subtilisin family [Agromyces sp. CF514]
MPRSQRPSAARRRSIAAAISGLAIGLAGVGAAALPAGADPADPGGPPSGASSGALGSHTVTLITGDRVTVTEVAGGGHAVEIDPVDPGEAFQTVEVAGELHVLPKSAMPFVTADVVDEDLFNVSRLIEFGYDDDSVDATPVILELDDAPTARGFSAPVPGVDVGEPLASIGGAAATATHADAEATWAALTDAAASDARAFSAAAPVRLGGGIAAIHLDGKVQATLDSSVPYIGAPEAWAAGYTGDGVTVAVLDTGYDDTHPDLAGRVLAESTSFVPDESVADDPNGHGTHVASTIAGTGAASGGTHRGVADGADLLVGKVLSAAGEGQDSWIISAMEWAAQRADIVSMSLGTQYGDDGTDLMSQALNEISAETDALFIVAAGNSSSPETIGSPGSASSALTIGSVDDPTGALSWFSSQGPLVRSGALKPDLAGPGNDVTAARSADSPGEGSYIGMSGTSMATPHVAGAAAIVKQQHPEYTGAQLRAALTSTATDVGLTPYQVGAGVVDVAAAITADVVASGSGDFGMLSWGEDPTPATRSIEYANRGDAEVAIDLTATLVDTTPGTGGGIEPMRAAEASDVLAMDVDSLTVPAGETRSVVLTADPSKVPAGVQLSGALTATVDGESVARTPLGIIAEAERYDLTVTATDFDGEPLETSGWIWNAATGWYAPFGVPGETTLRLPAGLYSVMSFMDVARDADTQAIALVGDPDVVLDGAATVAFDARKAKPVTVDVGERGLESTVRRMDYTVDGFSGSALAPVWVDELYAQPMTAPEAESFAFTTRWRLQEPTLSLTAGREQLDLIAQAGSTLLDGRIRAGAVDVGFGSAEEFAAVDVRGKVAVVTRSDTVPAPVRSANAVDAGAALLLTVNDGDGELSEWVGSDDYTANTPIPVASISGVQGRRVLDAIAKKPVSVTGAGIVDADEIWDVARFSDGSVPEKLAYRPKKLARIDTTYFGDPGLVGEYRYDFVPGTEYGSGFPMRTTRGLERTEWVSTDQVEWYQDATVVDAGWQVRDIRRAYEPGQKVETGYFGAIVRPYVGPGYWAPNRTGDYAQINVPSWADGANAEHTGAFDTYSGAADRAQVTEVYIDGELAASSPYQGATVWDLPDGETEWRVVNTATHDGTYLASSTATTTEWTFRSTGTATDPSRQLLPMLQASYDVDLDAAGKVGAGRKKGASVELGLELGHIAEASGIAAVNGATLEMRVDGGAWSKVRLEKTASDTTVDEPSQDGPPMFSEGRDVVTAYSAKLSVPDAGGWVDLRVTATDAAGSTFSQEIERAFEATAAKGGGHGHGGGHGGGGHGGPGRPGGSGSGNQP